MKREEGSQPHVVPFTVLVDGREKAPYKFHGLYADAKLGNVPLEIPVEWAHLPSGDYSIEGCEGLIAVERKSVEDLFSTLGQHRDRFEAEVARLAKLDSAAIVIEGSWARIMIDPPERSRLLPKTVLRTMIAWTQRYHVPWIPCEDRRMAESLTFRWLERWWHDVQEYLGESNEHCRVCGLPLRSHRSRARGLGPLCAARGDRLWALKVKKEGVNL